MPTGDGMGATHEVWAVISLIRAAGIIENLTVIEPFATIPGPPGTHPGIIQGSDLHRAVTAGLFAIITVGFPSINARGSPESRCWNGPRGWMGAWQ